MVAGLCEARCQIVVIAETASAVEEVLAVAMLFCKSFCVQAALIEHLLDSVGTLIDVLLYSISIDAHAEVGLDQIRIGRRLW